jgi:hypothetical protein
VCHFAGAHGVSGSKANLCPESLVIALLKELLFRSKEKKEALFTLEDKLCQKLRETRGSHIVSFEGSCGVSFHEFVKKHPENFQLLTEKGQIMDAKNTSRVVTVQQPLVSPPTYAEKTAKGGNESSTFSVSRKLDFPDEPTEPNIFARRVSHKTKLALEDSSAHESTSISGLQDTVESSSNAAVMSLSEDVERVQDEKAEEDENVHQENDTVSSHPNRYIEDSSIPSLLMRPENDVLIFRMSPDQYMNDNAQFTIDVISL